MLMPNISDIAKRAKVSPSTVSYVLSGKRPISEEVKQRVYQVMQELGYQPNSLARALVTKRTRIIALLYPSWTAESGPQMEFVTSIAATATTHGYALLLWTSTSEDQEMVHMSHQGFIDGAILMEVALEDPRVEMLKKQNLPFTLIGRCKENDALSFVDLDFDDALATTISYLVQNGHTHIALINQSAALLERGTGYVVRSRDAYYREMSRCGLEGMDLCCEANDQAGREVVAELLARDPALSAIILTTPWTSGSIIQALTDRGLAIPQDISLVAIFSPLLAKLTTPALTSVDFPFEEMGHLGAQMLIERLENRSASPHTILLKPPLTVRASSGLYQPR
jgi:DNA-binding LacI/PurR family transcriptional regulator